MTLLLKRLQLLSVSVLLFSLPAAAQMRKVYLDMVATYNSFEKLSFYSAGSGYLASTTASYSWVGFTSDTGHTIVKRDITLGNVNLNNYPVNLTFPFNIQGVKAFDQNKVIAYGDYGLVPSILLSTNGGVSYTLIYHSQFNPMELRTGVMDMVFPQNGSTGYAIDADRILKTTNGGTSWSAIRIDAGRGYDHLEAVDDNTVFAMSTDYQQNALFKTLNGGLSWQQVNLPAMNQGKMSYAYFLNALTGWVSMYDYDNKNVLYRTTDGGVTWTGLNDAVAAPFRAGKMRFLDANTGYALANDQNTVYKTTNGGVLWEPLQRDNDFAYLGYSHKELHFFSNTQFWAAGNRNFLELTTNGGGTPLPKAYFKTDRSNYATNGTIALQNFSNTAHTFKWYVNNSLVATTYNAVYTHAPSSALDSVKLVVTTSGGRKDSLTQYLSFYVAPPPPTYTGWEVKATGINDNLRDVRFYGNNGVMIGNNGFYYTTGGADNPARWKRYVIPGSAADNALLSSTKFADIAFTDHEPIFYLAGTDTVGNKAVFFRVNLADSSYTIPYVGPSGSRLNSISALSINTNTPRIMAVGNNGLVVSYNTITNVVTNSSFGSADIKSVFSASFNTNEVEIVANDSLFSGSGSDLFYLNYANRIGRTVKGKEGGYMLTDSMIYHVYSSFTSIMLDSMKYFKPANLQFRSIAIQSGGFAHYIATDHGIYKAYFDRGSRILDYQPTSGGRSVNNIWFRQSGGFDTGYAVGPNGLLMKTTNAGGPVKPYAAITGDSGTCVNGTVWLGAMNNSGNSCKWYQDGAFIQDWCGTYPQSFATSGAHQMMLVTSNADGVSDTATKIITVTPPPLASLPYTVSDTVLCKSESIQIAIRNTEAGFRYEFVEQGTGTIFGTVIGNGGQVSLQTSTITRSGLYQLRVTNLSSGCSVNFTNSVRIVVEHTRSSFVADKYNVQPGEAVNFFQASREFQSLQWIFGQDASTAASTSPNPQGITYATAGQKTLTLISVSENGCRDTLINACVSVYVPSSGDNCFALTVRDIDTSGGVAAEGTAPTILPDNGFLLGGTGNFLKVNSRYGQTPQFPKPFTAYLARYSPEGVVRWVNYIDGSGVFTSSTVDGQGNIYATGFCNTRSWCKFPNGDSVQLAMTDTDTAALGSGNNGFIVKMDGNGRYLWHTTFDDPTNYYQGYMVNGAVPSKIVWRNGSLMVTGGFAAFLHYVRGNQRQQLITYPNSTWPRDNQHTFLMKLRSDGSVAWTTHAKYNTTNSNGPHDIALDDAGNTYMVNDYEFSVKVFDRDSIGILDITGNLAANRSFLIKFDSAGHALWNARMRSDYQYGSSKFNRVLADAAGNVYVAGGHMTFYTPSAIVITNADGTQVSSPALSTVAVLKFNAAGSYRWGVGSERAYYGAANGLALKDDNLFVTGYLSDNSMQTFTYPFTSTDGINDSLEIARNTIFMAHYDTSGVLQKLGASGQNAGGEIKVAGIAVDNNSNLVVAGLIDNFAGNGSYNLFGSPLQTVGNDVFLLKMNPNFCFPSTPPEANAGRDTLVCPGSAVTLGSPPVAGNSYRWTSSPAGFASTLAQPLVQPSVTTTYYLAVRNRAGVFGYDTVVVATIPPPVANAGRDTAICAGSSVTLGSAAVSGYTYAWTSDPAGFSSSQAMPSVNPATATTYYLSVTGNAACAPTRDTVLVTINQVVTPSVSIATPVTTVCNGAPVTFTATPVNGGLSPAYQWKVNGLAAGTNSAAFTTSTLASGDVVSVTMTSNGACLTSANAVSNAIPASVVASVTPQVQLSASSTDVCAGTPVTFTAAPVNGGTAPAYQWKVNGVNAGTNAASFTTATLQSTDVVTVSMTSNFTCAVPATVQSAGFSINVRPAVIPTVSIQAGVSAACQGTSVTFTASSTNGGTAPQYQWRVNGIAAPATAATFTTAALAPNDQVTVAMTSNADCAAPATVVSAPAGFTVNPLLTPAVTITEAGGANICPGATAAFTAAAVNGGSAPQYQWMVNGVNAGTNSNTFTSAALAQGDVVSVVLTSNAGCLAQATASSNNLTMTVLPQVAPTISIQGTVMANQVLFQSTITNGGTAPAYRWQDSTAAHTWQNIAGATAAAHTYVPLQTGDKVRCLLTSNATCAAPATVTSNAVRVTVDSSGISLARRGFPNPANTSFTIDQISLAEQWEVLEIRDATGVLIATYNIVGKSKYQVNVQRLPSGRYIALLRRSDGKTQSIAFVKY